MTCDDVNVSEMRRMLDVDVSHGFKENVTQGDDAILFLIRNQTLRT